MLRQWSSALTASATTPLTAFYALPTDLIEIIDVFDTGGDSILRRVSIQDLGTTWDTDTGTPYAYLLLGTELRIYPYLTAARTLKVHYVQGAASLSVSSDTPAIPPMFHIGLVWYALAQCYKKDVEEESQIKARFYQGEFERVLDDAARLASRTYDASEVVIPYRDL